MNDECCVQYELLSPREATPWPMGKNKGYIGFKPEDGGEGNITHMSKSTACCVAAVNSGALSWRGTINT